MTARGFFGSAFYASGYFTSDFFRETVSVPVPVPVPVAVGGAGAGSAIWPARRLCKPDKRKKNPTFVNIFGKEMAKEADKKKRELGKLEEFKQVKDKFFDVQEKLASFSKELKERRSKDKLYEERDAFLIDEIAFFREELKRMSRLMEKLKRKSRPRVTLSQLANLNPEPAPTEIIQGESAQSTQVIVMEAPPQESPYVYMSQLAKDERTDVSTRALRALPWAFGSGLVGLGTWHLVPKKRKFVKFCGYASAGVLAGTAIWRWFEE